MGISKDGSLCPFHCRWEFGDSHCSRTQRRVPKNIQKEVGVGCLPVLPEHPTVNQCFRPKRGAEHRLPKF